MSVPTRDRFLGYCLHCGPATPAAPREDFCAECVEEGRNLDRFGRCYICREGDHDHCVGVPCECECPPPTDRVQVEREIRETEARLAELRAKLEAAPRP